MILGTVQLGMDYGINNSQGKPSVEEAFAILELAYQNNVYYLDTAASYGDSQRVIGEFQRQTNKYFRICTKLPIALESEQILDEIDKCLDTLCTEHIEVLYLHRFDQCMNTSIIRELQKAKKDCKVCKIGVSIYEPEELMIIVDKLSNIIDVVQIPINILGGIRWKMAVKLAQNNGIQIYARSAYLQGLFFKDENDEFIKKIHAEKYNRYVKQIAKKKGVTISQILLDYCKSMALDGILVGCENKQQLEENVRCFKKRNSLKNEDILEIEHLALDVPDIIIDPRRWNS